MNPNPIGNRTLPRSSWAVGATPSTTTLPARMAYVLFVRAFHCSTNTRNGWIVRPMPRHLMVMGK